jgi:hypothetical protein
MQRHLQKGGGLFHLCVEVDDLGGTLQRLRESGEAMVVCDPAPAPTINKWRVAFVVTSAHDVIEFVEAVRC